MGNGVSLSFPLSLPVGSPISINPGSIEFVDEGTVVARAIRRSWGQTATFFDPNYTPVTNKAVGASGWINLETGFGLITFTGNAPPANSTLYYRYVDNVVARDNGSGRIVGYPGATGSINYTTGAYANVTAGYALGGTTSDCYHSIPLVYGSEFSGPEYSVMEVSWKKTGGAVAEVTGDWGNDASTTEYYGATGRLGVTGNMGTTTNQVKSNLANGRPSWDNTNGLRHVFYQPGVTGNTQTPFQFDINYLVFTGVKFTNIGSSDVWIADNIKIDSSGYVLCDGATATLTFNSSGTITGPAVTTIPNNTWYSSITIEPVSPFSVTEFFGKSGSTSARFTTEVYLQDTNVEIY